MEPVIYARVNRNGGWSPARFTGMSLDVIDAMLAKDGLAYEVITREQWEAEMNAQ